MKIINKKIIFSTNCIADFIPSPDGMLGSFGAEGTKVTLS